MAEVRRRPRTATTQGISFQVAPARLPARLVVDDQDRVVALNAVARAAFGDVEGQVAADVVSPQWVGDATVAFREGQNPAAIEVLRLPASPTGDVPVGPRTTSPRPGDLMRGTFLANMSHELRTPLTSVLGFAQLLRSGRAGPLNEQQQHHLDRVIQGGEHLLHLVCDVLDLARIESGNLEFRPEPVDVSSLLEEAVAAVRPLADGKSLALACADLRAESAYLDPVRFKQVLYNYLSNAIKFTPEQGRISVRLSEEAGDRLRVEVEDTGIGIAADQVDRLFTEFTQIPNHLQRSPGAGLGLAITKRIVESMGGAVGVRSRLGQGSVFWAEFPRTAP